MWGASCGVGVRACMYVYADIWVLVCLFDDGRRRVVQRVHLMKIELGSSTFAFLSPLFLALSCWFAGLVLQQKYHDYLCAFWLVSLSM